MQSPEPYPVLRRVKPGELTQYVHNTVLQLMASHIVTVGRTTAKLTDDETVMIYTAGYELEEKESVELTQPEVHTTLESIYTAQRASSAGEWEHLPPVLADFYDTIVYTSYWIRAQLGNEVFEQELEELEAQDRFEGDIEGVEQNDRPSGPV